MKEVLPIYFIVTDIHLATNNIELVKKYMLQIFDQMDLIGIKLLFIGGDVFTARKSQPLSVLDAWQDLVDEATNRGLKMVAIPGNHDKVDYEAENSYLRFFQCESFELIKDHGFYEFKDHRLHLVPFFNEKTTYSSYLEKAQRSLRVIDGGKNYLLTHIAVNSVRNNDGSEVEDAVNIKSLNFFEKVFVGHYHNRQVIKKFIHYIGSLYQRNYGEDDGKGYTVVNDDGTHYYEALDFQKYITVKIDLDEAAPDEIDQLLIKHKESDDNIRFKFTGQKEKIAALDKARFDQHGIDVKCEYKSIEIDLDFREAEVFSGFNAKNIMDNWEEFSKEMNEDLKKKGTEYLKEVL